MSTYKLQRVQFLPVSPDLAWEFFSNPANLNDITPTYMNFRITGNSSPGRMYAGQIITYKVSPLFGIPVSWMTEITHVKDREYFVDEQRFGPYKLWHHTHIFREVQGGVEMTDIVYYKLPMGFLGRFAHWLFIKKQLNGIFNHRFKVLETRFQVTGKPVQNTGKPAFV